MENSFNIKFRDLYPDEIELRVGQTNDKGFSLLCYKTARVDMAILDETVGAMNWTKKFYQVKNTMICSIGIWRVDIKDYVWKDDAGDESNTEAVKGEASDSFKRAGFNWGIGRALYTSPFIWIKKDENNDPRTSRYSVKDIAYKDGVITKLVITNDKTGQVVFSFGSYEKVSQTAQKPTQNGNGKISESDKQVIVEYLGKCDPEKYNAFLEKMKMKYGVGSVGELTDTQGKDLATKVKANGN